MDEIRAQGDKYARAFLLSPEDRVNGWVSRNGRLANEARIEAIDEALLRDLYWVVMRSGFGHADCPWSLGAIHSALRKILGEVATLDLDDNDEPTFERVDLGFGDADDMVRDVARRTLDLPDIY